MGLLHLLDCAVICLLDFHIALAFQTLESTNGVGLLVLVAVAAVYKALPTVAAFKRALIHVCALVAMEV